jgi:DNA-binding ferritin-like protein
MDEFDAREDMRGMMDYMADTESNVSNDDLLEFVEDCIFLEALSHHWHLQCRLYSKHMELDELYKEIGEYVDAFIEGLMNTRGALTIGTGKQYQFLELDACVPVLEQYVQTAKGIHQMLDAEDDYGSVNSLEDIISFLERTLYKLKVLQ